jgi:hypothetical protein
MQPYVKHFDFVLSPPSSRPYNCSMISYGDLLRLSFVRNTEEPELELQFHEVARALGLHLRVESNTAALARGKKQKPQA